MAKGKNEELFIFYFQLRPATTKSDDADGVSVDKKGLRDGPLMSSASIPGGITLHPNCPIIFGDQLHLPPALTPTTTTTTPQAQTLLLLLLRRPGIKGCSARPGVSPSLTVATTTRHHENHFSRQKSVEEAEQLD